MAKAKKPKTLDEATLQTPTWAPEGATVHLLRETSGELRLGDRVLARLCWHDDGAVGIEQPLDARGRCHGLHRELHENGQSSWQVPWRAGKQHGLAKQFDRNGRLLMTSRFVRGAGVDIYCDDEGAVQELREFEDDVRHGVERWGDPTRPYIEEHLFRGKNHGIVRHWRGAKLEAGYPRYFVEGMEVTRSIYRAACREHPELPPDRRGDDHPARELPACLVDGRVTLHPRKRG